jgi:glycosyltransferase involved in cell wall biosynthesis
MSAFNDAVFLPEAVQSILGQTLKDFEFLIVDDGSTDNSASVLEDQRDPRVRIIRNEENLGLTASLGRGVTLANGRYIARMDADDVAFPHRLQTQADFLEHHPSLVLVGSACVVIDERGRRLSISKRPQSDLEIRWASLLTNPFVHSTVMIRREVLIGHGLNYDPAFGTAQDYDLWTRLLRYGEGANLSVPLIHYRVRSGVTTQRREHQLRNAFQIAARTANEYLPSFKVDVETVRRFWAVYLGEGEASVTREDWAAITRFYRDLFARFSAKSKPPAVTRKYLRRRQGAEIIHSIWRNNFPPHWLPMLVELLVEDPCLPFWCGHQLATGILLRMAFEKSIREPDGVHRRDNPSVKRRANTADP